jgi:hypothetical protein
METRSRFVWRWVCGTTFGWGRGLVVAFLVSPLLLQLESIGHTNSVLFLVIALPTLIAIPLMLGLSIGWGQWQLSLQGYIPKRGWLYASAVVGVTFVIGLMVGNMITPPIMTPSTSGCSELCESYQVADTWLESVLIFGVCIGLAVGLPQWVVLRRYRENTALWIAATIGASILTVTYFILFLQTRSALLLFGAICLAPPLFAFIIGFPLYNMLAHKPKPKHDDARIEDAM